MAVARSSSGRVSKSQGEGAVLGVFFRTDNALSSRAFGTDTKTAQPIEMPFGMMTVVGCRYHVLDGRPDTEGEWTILGENIVAHSKVMGHSTVSCAKMAEPINMPFWMNTRVA